MNLAKNFTPTPLLEGAGAAILPDLENLNASMGIDPSLVLMNKKSEKILGPLCF